MTRTVERPMVVIPTYNEIENIRIITDQILALDDGFHVLIVDDASPDGTGEVADEMAAASERVHVLHRKSKDGIGPAYVAGFQFALDWGAGAILQMDADLSHDPNDLPRLLGTVTDESELCDLAVGSRYKGGVRVLNWSIRRLVLSLGASFYVRLVLGLPIEDPTGGFKCWRREVLASLDLDHVTSKGYSFQIEMSYRALKAGFRAREVADRVL